MKDSGIPWIGQIPEHWEVVRFKSIFSTRKGLSITKADLTESGIPVINYGQIHSKYNNGTTVTAKIVKYVPNKYIQSDSNSLVNKGDFIFADTSEDISGCGNCAYIDCQGKIFGGYHAIIATGGDNNKYFAYLFLTDAWRSQIRCNVTGIKVFSISQAILSNTELIVPPKSEQEAIAGYLDKKCGEIDELIEVEKQMISDLESYRQAFITEAVTHGLNPDTALKETSSFWLPQIPTHWELHYLRGISRGFRKGSGITKEDLVSDGEIACIRYGDLYTRYNHYISDIRCRTNISKIQNPVFASFGDIYFTCSGEDVDAIGKSVAYLSNEDCLVGGDLIIMKHSQNPKFLGYSLDSTISQRQKSYGKSKLKVVHTSVKDLKNVSVAIPPLSEQQEIANYLDAKCAEIDELIKVKQEKIETLKQYRQSLIFEAVIGKLEIS